MNKTLKFEQDNAPNPAKLIESLRCLGYDNYIAVADIVDNSIDAEADLIKVRIWTEDGEIRISVADNGTGMDPDILDQALRLGSLTPKNPVSDLGKFGMGLVTAGLSLARRTTVITRQGDGFFTSVGDVDEVISRNQFCKYSAASTPEEREVFEAELPECASGTLVLFDKCDGLRNRNTTVFANTLRKHLGRIHRHFIQAGKSRIFVNEEPVVVVDPLEVDSPDTEIFSDESYPITTEVDGSERTDLVRIRIALIPENVAGGEHDVALGIKNQGFYIMRNNREIKMADTLDAFTKHNDFNRMRGEVFLTGDLDTVVGIDFTKREVVFDQSFKDQLHLHLRGQCTTIKRRESGRMRVKESVEIAELHEQAEKLIDQRAKLLVTPKTQIEKRAPRIHTDEARPHGAAGRIRKNFKEPQPGQARRCKFQYAELGPHGQIYECDLQGRTVVIRWNVEHPFYQRFILDQRSDGRLVTAVDYLIFSMATAELHTLSEDNHEVLNNYKAIVSANVRTLLA